MAVGRRPKVNLMTQSNERQPNTQDFTQTPEFTTAVASAVDKALGPILERLAAIGETPAASTPGGADLESFFRQMALSIAEISDQGTQRKRVAPEILAQRAKSHGLMIDAILEAKRLHDEFGEERPKYRAIGKMYLNERFIEPFTIDPGTKKAVPVELYWSGVPNEVMRPLNDAAEGIYRHFRDSIGSTEKVVTQAQTWISAGGLVIIGEPPARRSVGSFNEAGNPAAPASPFSDDLDVVGSPGDPNKPLVNVLGTVAPAARQNYQDRVN